MRNFLMTLMTLSLAACAAQNPSTGSTGPSIETLSIEPGSSVELGGVKLNVTSGRVVVLRSFDGPTTVGALDLALTDPSGKLINTEIHLGTQVVDGKGDLLIESDQMDQGEIFPLQLCKLVSHSFDVYSEPNLTSITLDDDSVIFASPLTGLTVQGLHLNVIASN